MFTVGDKILIKNGAFNKFKETVRAVNESKMTLTVKVDIYGRSEPVELKFKDVEKLIRE